MPSLTILEYNLLLKLHIDLLMNLFESILDITMANNNIQSHLSRNATSYLCKITYNMVINENSIVKINKIAIISATSFLQNFTKQLTKFRLDFRCFPKC